MTVVITRPWAQAKALASRVAEAGFEALLFPAIDIEPTEDPGPLLDALARLASYRLVIFVSPNAIAAALSHWPGDWPRAVAIAVMGPGSLDALGERGIVAPPYRILLPALTAAARDVSPVRAQTPRFDSESLLEQLDLEQLRGAKVLIVKGNGGRTWLAERLEDEGIAVDQVESYRRSRHIPDEQERSAMRSLIESLSPVSWIVTSSEAIAFLIESLAEIGGPEAVAWLKGCRWIVPHGRIAENATAAGVCRVVLSGTGDRGIVHALE